MDTPLRPYPLFSQCGLNCGLCPRFHADGVSRCPGCCGPGFFDKRPSCGVISCAQRHGGVEYCFQCEAYPCKKLEGAECVDSFITHRNMKTDFEKARCIGLDRYRAELDEKMVILQKLLTEYNDGRRKSFYCLAANLLPLSNLQGVMVQLSSQTQPQQSPKERAATAAALLSRQAAQLEIRLELDNKKK